MVWISFVNMTANRCLKMAAMSYRSKILVGLHMVNPSPPVAFEFQYHFQNVNFPQKIAMKQRLQLTECSIAGFQIPMSTSAMHLSSDAMTSSVECKRVSKEQVTSLFYCSAEKYRKIAKKNNSQKIELLKQWFDPGLLVQYPGQSQLSFRRAEDAMFKFVRLHQSGALFFARFKQHSQTAPPFWQASNVSTCLYVSF